MTSNRTKSPYVLFAVALLAASFLFAPIFSENADAKPGDTQSEPYVFYIVKGQTWEYLPTFTDGLTVTVSVPYQGSSWTSTNGTYATASSGKITVTIPANATSGPYKVVIKGESTKPTQTVYQYVDFQIVDKLTLSGTSTVKTYAGATVSWTPTKNLAATFTVSPSLPSGLSFDTSTGKISGKPTAASAAKDYTITATSSNPAQTATVKVNIFVEAAMTIGGDSTVYTAESGVQDPASVTCNLSGVTWSISDYGTMTGKVSVGSDGKITVNATSGDAGSHTITVKAKSPTTGQERTKNITVNVAKQLAYTSWPSAGAIIQG